MTADEAISALRTRLGSSVIAEVAFRGETSFSIPLESLRSTMTYLKNDLGFNYLIDISSLDHFGESPRFEMVYELYALPAGIHLRIKTTVPDDDEPLVPTISDLWPTADWHEREVYDMMGIKFSDHPDLRRILMWDGYPYYPLRKDFPLQGKPTDLEEVAFSEVAPLAGGPFVTVPTAGTSQIREPRARRAGDEPPDEKFAEF